MNRPREVRVENGGRLRPKKHSTGLKTYQLYEIRNGAVTVQEPHVVPGLACAIKRSSGHRRGKRGRVIFDFVDGAQKGGISWGKKSG